MGARIGLITDYRTAQYQLVAAGIKQSRCFAEWQNSLFPLYTDVRWKEVRNRFGR